MAKKERGERDLKKLKRSELLEIMLAQSEEIDRLRDELARKDEQLESRAIAIEESGSIAEASLRLTSVFEEAQKAADLYLENVKARAAAMRAATPPPSGDPLAGDAGVKQHGVFTRPAEPSADYRAKH